MYHVPYSMGPDGPEKLSKGIKEGSVIKRYWDTRKVPKDCAVIFKSKRDRRRLARGKNFGGGKNRIRAKRVVCALDFL